MNWAGATEDLRRLDQYRNGFCRCTWLRWTKTRRNPYRRAISSHQRQWQRCYFKTLMRQFVQIGEIFKNQHAGPKYFYMRIKGWMVYRGKINAN